MKRILLASTALVAFAGAAAAEITIGGDAELGYNDEFDNGMFYSFGLTVKGSMDLDNGVTAAISGDVEFNRDFSGGSVGTFDGNDITIDDLVMSLSNDMASLKFGDTAPAADKHWSAVGNMDADGFLDENDIYSDTNKNDSKDDGEAVETGVLIGEVTFGATTVALSYHVVNDDSQFAGVNDDLIGMQLAVVGSAGDFTYGLAYEDNSDLSDRDDIFGARVGATFGGADVALGYADNGTVTSTGLSVSYPAGPVTVGAFYVMQDTTDAAGIDDNYGISVDYAEGPLTVGALYHGGNDEDLQLNVTYDMGNGLNLFGGYRDEGDTGAPGSRLAGSEVFYIGGDYDLGGGANLRVSYADVTTGPGDDLTLDELGAAEDVKEGFTIAVGMSF